MFQEKMIRSIGCLSENLAKIPYKWTFISNDDVIIMSKIPQKENL